MNSTFDNQNLKKTDNDLIISLSKIEIFLTI